jgi:hypothetical protein
VASSQYPVSETEMTSHGSHSRDGASLLSRALAVGALAVSLCSGTKPPPITVDESVEWITRDSDLVIIGYTLQLSSDLPEPGSRMVREQVTVGVDRVILGAYSAGTLTFNRKTEFPGDLGHDARPQLLFLKRSTDPADWHTIGAPWILRTRFVFGDNSPGLPLANGGRAKTASDVVAAIQAEASKLGDNPFAVHVESRSDTFSRTKTLIGGEGHLVWDSPKGSLVLKTGERQFLIVPAYPHLHQYALELCKSTDENERARGAYVLRNFPDPSSVRILTALLKDASAYRWDLSSTTACAVYTVRVAAYDTLRDLGVAVTRPLLEECHQR